ncbi:hypothetical protein EBU99_06420 [bacterium]|nr:hypothetical protein [bacterium]
MGKVSFVVTGPNIAPQLATALKKYSDVGQNTPYIISYDTLKADLGITDIDSPTVSFVFTNINENAGKLVVSATDRTAWPNILSAAPPVSARLNKGEQLVFVPKDNFNGTNIEVFRVRAWDGEMASSSESVVTVDIARVNQIPLMTRVNTFSGAVQNTPFAFSYDDLRAKTDAYDIEEPLPTTKTLGFKVKSINSGSLRRVVSPGNYQALAPNAVLNPGENFEWTPGLNANGTLNAMSIVAYDSDGAESQAPLTVYVVTAAVNNLPVFTSAAFIPGATEDMPFVINYMMLNQYLPGTDVETGVLAYQLTSLVDGISWKKGNTTLDSGSLPITVYPGESITWTPPANKNFTSNGLLVPFTVKLLDGNGGLSTETKQVQVSVAAVNDQPKIVSVSPLGVVQKNHPNGFVISFNDIKGIIPLSDDDGTPANSLKYRIESVNSGTLRMGNTNAGALVDAPNNKPFLVSVPAGGATNETDQLNWTPPLNATGSFVVMTVRAFDGQDYSASTADVVVSVQGPNAKPVINTGFTLGATGSGTVGTKQNVPLLISYDTLLAQSQASDSDLTPVYFRITSLESGSLKVGASTYTTVGAINPPALVGPGESIVWRPAQEQYGVDPTPLNAFRMRSYDNADVSVNEALVKVSTQPVNQVPLFNSEYTNTTGVRNAELVIPFKDIANQLAVSDVEDVNPAETDLTLKYIKMKFRVEQLMAGQSLRIGADSATATAFDPNTNNMLTNGLNLYWLPPANVIGTYSAFRVTVMDSQNLPSANTAIYKVTVSGSNVAPALATTTVTFGTTTSAIENVPYSIDFDTLQTALGVSDVDSPNTQLVFTSISNGVLKKMGSQMAPFTAIPSAPATASVFAKSEVVMFMANANLYGNSIEMFKVRAWDGDKYSPEATVSLKIGRVNYKPRLTYVNDFSGGTEDTNFDFTYADLRGKTDLFDIEEVGDFGANTVRFVVKNLVSGTLQRRTSTAPLTYANVLANEQIGSADVLRWLPAANAYGRLQAFSLVALDGDNEESITTLPVYFNIAAVNDLPTFTATSFLSGAVEDQPFVITHSMLQASFPGADVENGTVSYQIVSLGGQAGTSLKKGAQTVAVGTSTAVINPGEFVTWQPPTDANSATGTLHKAFSIKLIDNDGGVSAGAAVDVNVSIAAVNDLPVFGSVSALPTSNQNNPGGIPITYAMLLAAAPTTDVETASNAMSYRIESISSGTLRMGNQNTGAVINPQVSRPLIINAVGDQVTTTGVVNWTPPLNAIGNYAVMVVRAQDAQGDYSASTAEIRINLTGSNAIPTILSTFTLGGNGVSVGTSQNVAMLIDYDTLLSNSQAADTDQTPLYFRITALSSGTLTVGLNTYSTPGALNPVPVVGPGEKIVWKPTFNASGPALDAFTMVASDNKDVSSASLVKVLVAYVNQPPQMNSLAEYSGANSASRNQYYTIDFSDMANRLGVTDSDDVNPTVAVSGRYNLLSFRIENILSGQFLRVGTSYASAVPVVTGTTLFQSGQQLYWMPPNNGADIYDAFSVTVIDKDGLASANMGKIRVNVAGSNIAPTATSQNTVLATASENTPLTLTYNQIKQKYVQERHRQPR